METSLWAIIVTLIAGIANALGGFYLKRCSSSIQLTVRGIFGNTALISGVLFYGLSTVLAVPAYRFGELSILYPLISTSYIWVTLLGARYMNESITKPKLIGIGCIIFGVFLIGFGAA